MAMPPNNAKQADVIDGADLLPNRNGSAPGQWLDTVGPSKAIRKLVILLPGPPKELKPLFDNECKPRLAAALPPASHRPPPCSAWRSSPKARSTPAPRPSTSSSPTSKPPSSPAHAEIQLHFVCVKPTLAEAEARVERARRLVEHEMGDDIFSSNGESLEEVVLLMLGLRDLTLAVAESCTGGLLAERLTSIPNSSRVFLGGAIVYADAQKTASPTFPAYLIDEHGAVSDEVARALAEGIRRRTGSSLGLSITGIAGPAATDGPDAGKPVGLVYIALADGEDTQVKRAQHPRRPRPHPPLGHAARPRNAPPLPA